MQEQSQLPVIPYWREASTVPAASSLDSLIQLQDAATMLYMTWGREAGGQQCVQEHCSIPFADFQHMQDSLSSSYRRLALELGADLCPVGEVWARAVQADPLVRLWDGDGNHSSQEGAYLSACSFYATLFGESPAGLDFRPTGLTAERALWLQQQAATELALPEPEALLPASPCLLRVTPNPFNPVADIEFTLPKPGDVELRLFDLSGRLCQTLSLGPRSGGEQHAALVADDLASGVYLLALLLDGRMQDRRKTLLMK